jgi:amino acid efflux transporter
VIAAVPDIEAASVESLTPLDPAQIGAGAFLLLFAFVGWEAAVRNVRRLRHPRRESLRAAAFSALIVSLLYGSVAVAAFAVAPRPSSEGERGTLLELFPVAGEGVGRAAVALAAAAICAWLCARNFAASAEMARELAIVGVVPGWLVGAQEEDRPARSVVAVALAVLCGLIGTLLLELELADLLDVPNAMALTIYLIAAATGVTLLEGRARLAPLLAFVGWAALVPFVGPAVLIPVLVTAAFAARLATSRRRSSAGEAAMHRHRPRR